MEVEQVKRGRAALDGRRLLVLEARAGGATFRDIAEQLDITLSTAHRDYQMAIKLWATPMADDARQLELVRLDRLQLAYWQKALDGDYQAAGLVRQYMQDRRKLLGLDEPRKIDITATLERVAEEAGIDVEEALRDADEIIRRAGL